MAFLEASVGAVRLRASQRLHGSMSTSTRSTRPSLCFGLHHEGTVLRRSGELEGALGADASSQ